MSPDSYTPCRARVCGLCCAFLTPLCVNGVMHRKAALHHAVPSRSPGFASPCIAGRNARRNALFAGARAMQRPNVASIVAAKAVSIFPSPRSAAQIIRHGGFAGCVSSGLLRTACRARPANLPCLNHASRNAHIEWRFP
ncbi:hypothetical protein Bphy_4359 [Paraburkholderia phymatum STM815]|uniref:Uncharacterized protein n=1 Tax=Paraburkholderia phymatum (strain DSM 17167 / CIP 108236 / LMG 21445 / STM815) TaxID=391038 RepID=B2JQD3_PARP8|nr:hypothetical protein Bphy_4359 [Paraburkholderia phymatum STM815]